MKSKSHHNAFELDDVLIKDIRQHREKMATCANEELQGIIKKLRSKRCSQSLLMWAALFGTIEAKQAAAENKSASPSLMRALMMDSESAPWYVLCVLGHENIFAEFIGDLYGANNSSWASSSLENYLSGETLAEEQTNPWLEFIPRSGTCNVLQAELIRISNELSNHSFDGGPYDLERKDELYVTLNLAIDMLKDISTLSRNILRALVRLEQISKRSFVKKPPSNGWCEGSACSQPVVDLFLRQHPVAIPFTANY